MSDDNEFQRSDAATGNVRRPTTERVKREKYSINNCSKQSTLNCSYTALTVACRGPNTRRRQSSAELAAYNKRK